MAVSGVLGGHQSTLGLFWLGGNPILEDAIDFTDSILAHYPLDDNVSNLKASDVINDHTLTLTVLNSLIQPDRPLGDYPSTKAGIELNVGNYLRSGNTFNFATGALEIWFKISADITNGIIAGFYDSSSKNDKVIWINNDGSLHATANDGTNKSVSISNYGLDRWHMATLVVDGTNLILYLDGGTLNPNGHKVSTPCGNTINTYTTNNFYVAGGLPDTYNAITGIFDEITIWNRVLTDQEIYERFTFGSTNLSHTSARNTQEVVEVLRTDTVNAIVTQEVVEVLINATVSNRVTQFIVEVLRTSADTGVTVSQTVTVSDSIVATRVISKSISNSITVTDKVIIPKFANLVQNITVDQSYSTRINKFYNKLLTQGITATQSIKVNRSYTASVSHTVVVAQSQTTLLTTLVDNISVEDLATCNKIITRAIIDNVNVSDNVFINSPRVIEIKQFIVVSDLAAGRNGTVRMTVADTVFVSDVIAGRNGINRQAVSNTVTVSQNIILRDAINRQSVSDNITVISRVNTIYTRAIIQDINIVDVAVGVRSIERTLTDDLTLTETYLKTRSGNATWVDDLLIIENLQQPTTFTRDYFDSLTLNENYFVIMVLGQPLPPIVPPGTPYPDPTPRNVPGLPVVKNNQVVLGGTLVLPAPDLGDSESPVQEVMIKRSITGTTYTYVKNSLDCKLKYAWTLGTTKALELADFLLANYGNKFSLLNWKGEYWNVACLTDPQLVTQSLFKKELEANQVTIEFQGVRLYG